MNTYNMRLVQLMYGGWEETIREWQTKQVDMKAAVEHGKQWAHLCTMIDKELSPMPEPTLNNEVCQRRYWTLGDVVIVLSVHLNEGA